MAVFVDIFETLNLKGVFYYRADFSPFWAVEIPKFGQAARFHHVIKGSCYFTFPTGRQVKLNPGDMVLIPRGSAHILSSEPKSSAPKLETVLADAGYDGKGVLVVGTGNPDAMTQLACGHLSFPAEANHPLLQALPEFIHVTVEDRMKNVFLDECIRMIVRSVMSDGLGSAVTVKKLSEIIFVEMIGSGIGANGRMKNVLRAFSDEHIGHALDLIHKNVSQQWTVKSLATEVGMSRSRFAEQFSELLGMGPMKYVSEWRLQKAINLLSHSSFDIQTISTKLGFSSPAAFTRAFNAKFGTSPSKYRKNTL